VVFSIEAALSNFISVCKRNSISVIFMPFFVRTNYVAKHKNGDEFRASILDASPKYDRALTIGFPVLAISS
jgi:hypothetical protein